MKSTFSQIKVQRNGCISNQDLTTRVEFVLIKSTRTLLQSFGAILGKTSICKAAHNSQS